MVAASGSFLPLSDVWHLLHRKTTWAQSSQRVHATSLWTPN